nr:immunoglobulin light chain junction region [Macaca mulatta]
DYYCTLYMDSGISLF